MPIGIARGGSSGATERVLQGSGDGGVQGARAPEAGLSGPHRRLVIAASGAFAHDLYINVWRGGQATDREQFRATLIAAGAICVVGLVLALGAQGFNLAFFATLAFAMAASANLPTILLTIHWSRFNLTGAVSGMVTGLVSSVGLVLISPNLLGEAAIFPFNNPALVSTPPASSTLF